MILWFLLEGHCRRLKMGFWSWDLLGVPFVCEDCGRYSLAEPPLQSCP